MKKSIILLFALFANMTAWAELSSGHFFKSLQKENLTEAKAVERFNQWFVLPSETEWRKVSERTDKMGMTRIEYRQYVSGVEVEHSQVLLHMKNGRVQTANGTVMEAPRMPAKLRPGSAVYKNGTPNDLLGRQLYLTSTKNGYRYATKALSPDGSEWIYTDVETGETLKCIPTHYRLTAEPVKVKGLSYYSGEVEMDASFDPESGTYYLYDQERNIHTMIGATIPTFSKMIYDHTLTLNLPDMAQWLPAPEDEMTEEMWRNWDGMIDYNSLRLDTYIKRNATYASSKEPVFDSYIFNTITIDRLAEANSDEDPTEIVPTENEPLTLCTEIIYPDTDGMLERSENTVTSFPFTLNLKAYHDELPTIGADIELYRVTTNENGNNDKTFLTSITLTPDDSGRMEWDTPLVKASATYEKSAWTAADIHWGMQRTYDFYKKFFDRDSFDDKGTPIYNLFYMPDTTKHYGQYFLYTPMNNACAINAGTSQMVYGMGSRDGGIACMYPVVELTVMSHEMTHMVTHSTADLVYLGESGALNESFSDLMGISVKKYVLGNDASWSIGEGVMEQFPVMRSLENPKTSMDGMRGCPDTYQGEFWMDTEDKADNGGVHINSGVQNKWYFLLTDGGSGTNDNDYSYEVTGIGIEKSQQIAYRTLTVYATRESQYADIRLASLQAAKDLYGENGVEVEAVEKAWKAVGVGETGTAIKETYEANEANGVNDVYDLSGRRVSVQLPKGIYISNRRKVLVK